jgi:hypothetical protein
VRNTKLVLEAGFLITKLRQLGQIKKAVTLERAALQFLDDVKKNGQQQPHPAVWQSLHRLAVAAWRCHFKAVGIKI